ncbi:hypothetical protein D3C80_2150660 [compost metagenome]
MLVSGDEILTILTGEEASKDDTLLLLSWLRENYPDAEVEIHEGGQPIYYYLFSVES